MLTTTRKRSPLIRLALPTLVSLLVIGLLGCGGGASTPHSNAANSSRAKEIATKGAAHSVYMFPSTGQEGTGDQTVIIHVESVAISRDAFARLDRVLTPKIASYEPKTRVDCSSERAPVEVKLPARGGQLSAAEVKALCIRQHQQLVRETALQQLISNQWVVGEAAELGLGVSEAEARKSFEKVVAQQFKHKGEFAQYLANTGRSEAEALFGVRVSLATERIQELIKRKVQKQISDQAIARFYRDNKAQFSTPEKRDIRVIRTWTRGSIEKAIAEVRSGKPVAEVAKRVSIDKPSNEHGGLIEGVAKGQEEAGLDQAIFKAKPGELKGPLHLRKRYYAFEVVDIAPEQHKPLKEIELFARQKLTEALLEKEKARFIRAFRKKWLARTSCSPGYVVSRCKQWRGKSVLDSEDAFEVM